MIFVGIFLYWLVAQWILYKVLSTRNNFTIGDLTVNALVGWVIWPVLVLLFSPVADIKVFGRKK